MSSEHIIPTQNSSTPKSLRETIFNLEAKAAEGEMIASLTNDEETKLYNRGLAKQLRQQVARLKANLKPVE